MSTQNEKTTYPSEFRRSTLLDRWVMIAPGRAKRPDSFAEAAPTGQVRDPFLPENVPPEDIVDSIPNDDPGLFATESEWRVLAMKNKFPFLVARGNPDVRGQVRDGYGYHELVIHSPDADKNFETFSTEQTELVLEMYRRRLVHLNGQPHIKYVQIFTNRGKEAGASVVHPHSQIVALPFVPPYIERLLDGTRSFHAEHGRSLIDDEVETESADASRLVEQNEHFVAYCPFAPRVNYHVRVLPRSETVLFREISPEARRGLAEILNRLHRRLNAAANVPPYNVLFRTAPAHEKDLVGFRWHVDLVPHLATPGGLELSTGIDVVTIPPELAAAELRDAAIG